MFLHNKLFLILFNFLYTTQDSRSVFYFPLYFIQSSLSGVRIFFVELASLL